MRRIKISFSNNRREFDNWLTESANGWHMFEACLGAALIFMISLMAIMGSGFILITTFTDRANADIPLPAIILIFPSAIINLWLLWKMGLHIRNKWLPVAPRVALALQHWNIILRWIAAACWLAQFAMCILFIITPIDPDDSSVGIIIFMIIWRIAASYAALMFLLLIAFSLTCRTSVIAFLWRHRIPIDLIIFGACTAFSIWCKDLI